MFKSAQRHVWASSIRSLLVSREFALFASSEKSACRRLGAACAPGRKCQQTSGKTTKTVNSSHRTLPACPDSDRCASTLPSTACLLTHQCQGPQNVTDNKPLPNLFTFSKRTPIYSSRKLLNLYVTHCGAQHNFLQTRSHHTRGTSSSFSFLSCIANHSHAKPQLSTGFNQSRAPHNAARRIADARSDCLSQENESRCRRTLQPNWELYDTSVVSQKAQEVEGKNKGRWASILVALCSVEGQPAFLFTLRSCMLMGRHKGDVSFAGGKSDPVDKDVVATALREAQEELGISVSRESVWGILKPLRDMSGMMIVPVLANLGPLEELAFKPNPEEVEEIFTLSVSHLCDPQNRGYTHFRIGDKYAHTLPVFRNGKHRVWGLTAVALEQTLKLVVPQ